jgi:hypothetical protein
MTNDFDCEFDLPRPTKVKFAKIAFAGAAATVAVVGVLLSFALDSFKTALANVGVSAPSFLSFPTLVGGLAVLFSFCWEAMAPSLNTPDGASSNTAPDKPST